MTKLFRIETDTLGEVEVPNNALWGAQTQRAIKNFAIGNDQIPLELIYAVTSIKKAAAIVNHRLGVLSETKKNLIVQASEEILKGLHDHQFPLKVWQTGSGTQTNMNINEVISNLGCKTTNNPLGNHDPLHPNDDVNLSQSTNDVFPAGIQIATILEISNKLLPELDQLIDVFNKKATEWHEITKIGRTHLQDAVPITLGQEVSAWRDQIAIARLRIYQSLEELYQLPLGGTAVGTGINCPKSFDKEVTLEISKMFNLPFTPATNKFTVMASHDGLVNTMSQLKLLSVSLLKIFNDIRFLSCGPRAGIAELDLPINEPGSSIMPGKVNPTQCEAMAMVCTQVMGLDLAVSMAGAGGHLQMNVFKPLIGFNLLKSIGLLYDSCKSCRVSMIEGITPNRKHIDNFLHQSLMLVTALTPTVGYEKASEIAQYAFKNGINLRQAATKLKYISEKDFDQIVNPKLMTGIDE